MTVTQTLTIQHRAVWKDTGVTPDDQAPLNPVKFDFELDGSGTYVESSGKLSLTTTPEPIPSGEVVTRQFLLVRCLSGTVLLTFTAASGPAQSVTAIELRAGEEYSFRLATTNNGVPQVAAASTAVIRYWMLGKST